MADGEDGETTDGVDLTPSDDERLRLLSRSELEARVSERTASLQNLMDTMVDVLLKVDPDGRVAEVNAAVEDVLGYEPETVVGEPVDYLFADPGDADTLATTTGAEFTERLLLEGQVTDVEVAFRRTDGEVVPMSLSASVLREDGEPAGIVCVAKDISDRVAAEERAEFLHSLLRHNLGNRLQIVSGYLDVLEQAVESGDDVTIEEYDGGVDGVLSELRYGIDGAVALVEDVRALREARDEADPEPVELGETIAAAVQGYEEAARSAGVTIEVAVEDPPRVMAGSLLGEVFSNLIENAINHSRGSRVRVATAVDEERVTVTVEDDGVGIPEERREAILERGEKGADSGGTGLGMHLVSLIVERYGELRVDDSDLGGARFDVVLRRADAVDESG